MWIPDQYLAVQDMSDIPSLLPHQLGQVVKIVGRPSDFRGSIQITFEQGNSVVCTDPNDETVFRLRVLKLEKDVYSRPVVLPDIVLQEARMRKDLKADVTLASLLDHLRAWTTGRKVQEFEFIEMLDNEQNRLFARHVVQTETPRLLPDETEKQVRSMMVKCLGQLVKEGTIETIDVEEMTFRVARRTIAREVVEQDAAGKSRKVVLLDDDDDD
ncbi:hypothetical protein BGZ98_006084 [Dissophora globulifera]|nr:hypothetical protein BGZ98_006084 [Dissophora globulifera]